MNNLALEEGVTYTIQQAGVYFIGCRTETNEDTIYRLLVNGKEVQRQCYKKMQPGEGKESVFINAVLKLFAGDILEARTDKASSGAVAISLINGIPPPDQGNFKVIWPEESVTPVFGGEDRELDL
jgi:hypothetical protein